MALHEENHVTHKQALCEQEGRRRYNVILRRFREITVAEEKQ